MQVLADAERTAALRAPKPLLPAAVWLYVRLAARKRLMPLLKLWAFRPLRLKTKWLMYFAQAFPQGRQELLSTKAAKNPLRPDSQEENVRMAA